jgi:tetrahydromethanopterin:alpha-L-glutamate ligase
MDSRRVVIFTDDPGWHGKQLQQAFRQHGLDAEYVSLTACQMVLHRHTSIPVVIPGFEKRLPDGVFVRGVPGGSLEEVVFYLDILHALKLMGVPVYNDAHAIERSVDKGMTSFLLHRNALPTPETWELRESELARSIVERELKLGHYVMSKPVFGSQGEGIRRFEKMTDLFWMTASRGIYYLQRFIQCSGEGFSDTRVFVINGQAVAAMQRHGVSWLNNVAQGASCFPVVLNPALANLAVKAAQTLNMDYAGIDIIQDREGAYWVIEVNSIPAWKGLQSVCDLNIAQLLVDDLVARYIPNSTIEQVLVG